MDNNIQSIYFQNLLKRYPDLESCASEILKAYETLADSFSAGGKLLVAGNGGSAADAEHIAGELMKSFLKKRALSPDLEKAMEDVDAELGKELKGCLQQALPTIALDSHTALNTAIMNDGNPLTVFAQQVNGYGREEDVFLAISTSGKSRNILYAAVVAKAKGMKVIGLTGEKESKLSALADVCIKVPETECYKVQERHLPIYHTLCLMLEEKFFSK